MYGWIKLHRKIIDSIVFQNEKCFKIWLWCICKASHKDTKIMIGKQKIFLKKGQFIMGGITAEDTLRIARTTIYYWLNFLEQEKMVDIKKTNKYTVITIRNWDSYQEVDIKKTSNYTTNGHKQECKEEDIIIYIWQKTWCRNPKIPEYEETERLIKRFGAEKVESIFKQAVLDGFHKLKTLINSLDEEGNIRPKEGSNGTTKQYPKKRKGEFDPEKFRKLLNNPPKF